MHLLTQLGVKVLADPLLQHALAGLVVKLSADPAVNAAIADMFINVFSRDDMKEVLLTFMNISPVKFQ